MINRTLETAYLDGLEGRYPCYTNKNFYLHGYATYFTKETAIKILTDIKASYDKLNYKTTWNYNETEDTFIYEDLENGELPEFYKGTDLETEDGVKHLYPIGMDWMWQIEE